MREPNPRLAEARRRKAELLPQIARLRTETRAGLPAYVDAVLDHIVVDQLVRKTIVFCEQKRPEIVGIEAEQFQNCWSTSFADSAPSCP